ncbi:MAG: diguanylate cyclase [Phycisphaerales bacterium]|nr:diguanylate cyclase [Phycisphaerales bacterium]
MSLREKPILLLVDDSPMMHRLLSAKLKDESLEIVAAFSAAEGHELAGSHQPALILVDIMMPEMNGLEFLRKLKSDPRTMQIPVIVLSATTKIEDKVAAFEIGAMDFVPKPFELLELRARIDSALRITRLMRLLEQRARIDGLTGLWNRAYFDERLAAELSAVERKEQPLALAMCDLDHFKRLNDSFGHSAGDMVLQSFAALLNQELRGYDVACRYGGEEFAVIMPGTTVEEGVIACERVRRVLEVKAWPRFPDIHATGSFGVTGVGLAGSTEPAAWIEAADRALYAAKSGGRNRVLAYDPATMHEGDPKKTVGTIPPAAGAAAVTEERRRKAG